MKQVLEQYGAAIISVLMATTVLAVIWNGSFGNNQGLAQVLGHLLGHSIEEGSASGSQAYDDYMSSAAPSIEIQNCYLVENQRVLLTECFQAKSYEGEVLPVYLKKAWSLSGEETDLGLSSDGSSICVPEAGLYFAQVYAVDSKKKETCIQVKLLVNER